MFTVKFVRKGGSKILAATSVDTTVVAQRSLTRVDIAKEDGTKVSLHVVGKDGPVPPPGEFYYDVAYVENASGATTQIIRA